MMSEKKIDKEISFREYIDKNINLLTVLGIFNALAIFSSSLEKNFAIEAEYLGFIFTLMSAGVLWVLIIDVPEDEEKLNLGFTMLKVGLVLCQFILIYIAIRNSVNLTQIAIFLASWMIYGYYLTKIITEHIFKIKFMSKHFKIASIISYLLIVIIPFLLAGLTARYLRKFIEFMIENGNR